eukprot:gene15417-biopygen6678
MEWTPRLRNAEGAESHPKEWDPPGASPGSVERADFLTKAWDNPARVRAPRLAEQEAPEWSTSGARKRMGFLPKEWRKELNESVEWDRQKKSGRNDCTAGGGGGVWAPERRGAGGGAGAERAAAEAEWAGLSGGVAAAVGELAAQLPA